MNDDAMKQQVADNAKRIARLAERIAVDAADIAVAVAEIANAVKTAKADDIQTNAALAIESAENAIRHAANGNHTSAAISIQNVLNYAEDALTAAKRADADSQREAAEVKINSVMRA